MSRRAAIITQADVARVIRAAKQAGAAEVEVRIGMTRVIVHIAASSTDQETPLEHSADIVL